MSKRSKAYLDSYREDFISLERRYRDQCEAWDNVLKELHIDRGTLLGSKQYNELSGVERADTLERIDSKIGLCYDSIQHKKTVRDSTLTPKKGFKYRCAIIQRKVCALSDKALGVEKDD